MSRLLASGALLWIAFLVASGEEKPADLPPDLKLVPHDTLAFGTCRVGDLLADARVKKLLPMLPAVEADSLKKMEKELGVNPADIERATKVTRRVIDDGVVILRMKKAIDRDAVIKGLGPAVEAKVAGKTIVVTQGRPGQQRAAWIVDGRTLVLGLPEAVVGYLRALEAGGKAHPFADELKIAAGKHSIVGAFRVSMLARTLDAELRALRDGFKKELDERPFREKGFEKKEPPERPFDPDLIREKPLKLLTIEEIVADHELRGSDTFLLPMFAPAMRADRVHFTLDVAEGSLALGGRADFASEDDAKDGLVIGRMGLYMAREMLPAGLMGASSGIGKSKAVAGFLKQYATAVRAVELKRDGKRVTVSGKVDIDFAPLVKLIAEERPILIDSNNLKQIGLAIHNYEGAFGHLPEDIKDKDGKPILSWRVALLPFIEQDHVYKSLDLTRPWDSPENKKLLAAVPPVYAPVKKADEAGITFYQMFRGPKTLLDGKGRKRFADVRDGLSNTIFVAEAAKGVHWAKPADMEVTAKALPKMGGQFEKFFHVLMGDGSVRKVRRNFDEKLMRLAIDPADDLKIDLDKLNP